MPTEPKIIGSLLLGFLSFWVPAPTRAYSSDTSEPIIAYTGIIVFVVIIFALCYYILKIKRQRVLDKIRTFKVKDPGFDAETFQSYVSAAYFKLMDARMTRDLKPVETYLSPAMLGVFQTEVNKHIQSDTFPKMDELSLEKAWIQDIRGDNKFDIIDIWVGGKGKTYTVDRQGQCIAGSASKFKTWDEKWTFIRPLGVATVKEGSTETQWVLDAIGKIQDLSDPG